MVRETTALHPLQGRISGGASRPVVVECLQGEEFVLKAPTPGWPQALKNELVGSRLIEELDLPIPEFALIHVGERVAQSIAQVRGLDTPPGTYFGVEFRKGAFPLNRGMGKVLKPADLMNYDALPGVKVFDTWARNGDRHDENMLLQPTGTSSPAFRAWLVDHGLILGRADWTPDWLDATKDLIDDVQTPAIVQRALTESSGADSCMSKIETLSADVVRAIPAEAPTAWAFNEDEREAVASFLEYRKQPTRDFLFPRIPEQPDSEAKQ